MPNDAGKTSSVSSARGGLAAVLVALVVALAVLDVGLAVRWRHFEAETATLRTKMSQADRERASLAVASRGNRERVQAENWRRRARADGELHLSIVLDSGRATLERDGVVLRTMRVRAGAARVAGRAGDTLTVTSPRGIQLVTRVLGAADRWDVPRWVFADRGATVPEDRALKGALGRAGILLEGGALLYAPPQHGPLADPAYVLPGAVLFTAEDMRAVAPNISAGMAVYFLE